jgi:hypothetical protein
MTSEPLLQRWGSRPAWLRALFLRANLIHIFRDELTRLELDELESLNAILTDGYLTADLEARKFEKIEEAFGETVELLKANIEQRIELVQGGSDELRRLQNLVDDATALDFIQEIFDSLSKRSRQIYRAWGPRRTVLEREWLADHPRKALKPGVYRDPYHVDAVTTINQRNVATIELRVHLDRFDTLSLLAVPALLTHELVCHAHSRETGSDSKSMWAEGVMDWAAQFFFQRWSPGLDLPYSLTTVHGRELWQNRGTSDRHSGQIAAMTLLDWLRAEPQVRTFSVAEAMAARLTLEVNATDASLLAKDRLASRLADVWSDEDLQGRLRVWLSGSGPAGGLLA